MIGWADRLAAVASFWRFQQFQKQPFLNEQRWQISDILHDENNRLIVVLTADKLLWKLLEIWNT